MNTNATTEPKQAVLTLRIPENAAALRDLVAKRQALLSLRDTLPCENVPAGSKDGQGFIHQAIEELSASIASLVTCDLTEGKRWSGGW